MGVLLVMRLRVLYDFKKKMSIEKKTGIHGTSPIDCRLVSQELYKTDRTLWEKLPRLVQGNYNSVSLYEQAIDTYSARFENLPFINDIVKNAVLLDSFGLKNGKSPNSLLMHSLYAVADVGNGQEVVKLLVEEMNAPRQRNNEKEILPTPEYRKSICRKC